MVIDVKLKNKIGIYKLMIANHIYVGSSINLYKRLLVHSNELHKCEHHNTHLQRCVNKYGFENAIKNNEIRKKAFDNRTKSYCYANIHFDSAPELAMYIFLTDNRKNSQTPRNY